MDHREDEPGGAPARHIPVLPAGPQDPVVGTPPRRPGSVRRTTSVDVAWGGPGQVSSLRARGRDLRTRADGTGEVVATAGVTASVEAGVVSGLTTEPVIPALDEVVGQRAGSGFRGRVDELIPAEADRATVLHQLLDDLPVAVLISGYGSSLEREGDPAPSGLADGMADLCSGWATGATMLDALERSGVMPLPHGPPAPPLATDGDPEAWHDAGERRPGSVRRVRRIDVVGGEALTVDVHFRDAHLPVDGPEDVLHEYLMRATVDPETLVVLSSEAEARTLPWPECPGAVASAARIVGTPVGRLRPQVRSELVGVGTCTHLNDVLRSLAGVSALAAALD